MDLQPHKGKLMFLFGVLAVGGIALVSGTDIEHQHIDLVGSKPKPQQHVFVESLNGPPAPYNAANVTTYSKVTFKKGEKFPEDIVCLEAKTPTSMSLACSGIQNIPMEVIREVVKETVKELKP